MVPQEDTDRGDPVSVFVSLKPFQNYICQGEDYRKGALLLEKGTRLDAASLGVLAGAGITEAEVYRRPRVGLLTTGDEVVSPGTPLPAGKIYGSNQMLMAEQLPGLLAAGLDGVNLSLDTLDRVQYQALTRRDGLEQALDGLNAALAAPGLTVKVNCVPSGENDDQLVPLAALAKDRNLSVRFIELMPIGLGSTLPRRTETEVLARLEAAFGPALPCPQEEGGGPSRYVTFQGFRGQVGFISAVSHRFCSSCDRVRLTAAGFLKTCLQYDCGVDLKALLEQGADDAALTRAIREAIARKPEGHHFGQAPTGRDEDRNMNQIGG